MTKRLRIPARQWHFYALLAKIHSVLINLKRSKNRLGKIHDKSIFLMKPP